MRLLDWCTANATPFIYASSASTYGDGAQGFRDDRSIEALKTLRPMNLYGWSKHLFDMAVAERAARGDKLPPQWAGLEILQRVRPQRISQGHDDERAGAALRRYQGRPRRCSCSSRTATGIADGDQRRDFIYVDDVVRVMMWLLATPSVSGIFNVGTGKARSFRDLMLSAYAALGTAPNIEYVDMPETDPRQLPVLYPKRCRSAAARRL